MVLLKIIRSIKQKEKDIRILMLGLDNAGKTTVVKKFSGDDISTISPTLGFDIKTLEHRGYNMHIWDVGGQSSIRAYWRNYFEQTDALIWVVDSADTQRMEDCKRELQSLLLEERLAGATLLVLANKQDLVGALSCSQICDFLELKLLETRHWCIEPVSATSGAGLLKAVNWMVDDVSARIFMSDD